MCGIFGIINSEQHPLGTDKFKVWIDDLFRLSDTRGKEASGIALVGKSKIKVYKKEIRGKILIRKSTYNKLFSQNKKTYLDCVIGHSRLATNGLQTENRNNQPVWDENGLVIHNGIIVNDTDIWKKILKKRPALEVDTEVLPKLFSHFKKKGYKSIDAIKKSYSSLEGSASIAFLPRREKCIYLATNTGSLYFAQNYFTKSIVFASEEYILKTFFKKNTNSENWDITHLRPGEGLCINFKGPKIKKFKLSKIHTKPKKFKVERQVFEIEEIHDQKKVQNGLTAIYGTVNDIKKIKRHDFDYAKIKRLKRCGNCILPETMTAISFDEKGVCNYCTSHKKITYKGSDSLKELVEPFRKKNGEPDCILAFSGGRDSSYGLHYLKKVLKMNPIAYTYDWGMVTDIARRNEARMVGKLGVEHIIVSADITMKRNHIKKHVSAWMKKPDLGMVPLFMEGDKQCEYYADELAKKMDIKLIFYCRGNEFENEEFKWGHCGIKDATPKGVIHNLSMKGKLQIAVYYLKQYLTNPSYINSSIADTLFAYYSTYVQKHDYIYLWHYIKWDEKKIVDTLIEKYNWEVHPETKATWRTDDGTSAFYNYIYYAGQGFTENDTFRSNQIREGLIDRSTALKLVNQENKPRHDALKWYFDRIGLDGDNVLTVVDNMKTLY